jgi:Zn-dependent M28 family amino/carboxypeptidase
MVGRGRADQGVVLGTRQNPALADVLDDARRRRDTGIKRVVTGKAEHLWERSDHHPFHRIGVPVLFFFEAESESENEDYHTYRDTLAGVSADKVARIARFVFTTAWLLAEDDERPPPPRD